jgi:hypothetical protein
MNMEKRAAWWPRERVAQVRPAPPGAIPATELRRLVAEMID